VFPLQWRSSRRTEIENEGWRLVEPDEGFQLQRIEAVPVGRILECVRRGDHKEVGRDGKELGGDRRGISSGGDRHPHPDLREVGRKIRDGEVGGGANVEHL